MLKENKKNLATLHYFATYYQLIKKGSYVICAVTGKKINLNNLNYWNIKRQEAYIDSKASFKKELEILKK